ncbi:unnamed protein product [Callosobruchus maculatus]|uniref:Reverse transcriptase domain-containing protein n=1 Tax=Callosobruchus maculatus TaxID=64391 RepID=A0A653DYW3_CALMS|nr:unnamed protein product [Callosobruchus maculatus]
MNTKTNNLKLGHVNIRSLLPSLNHVEELLTTVELDILGISETWLRSSVLNCEVEISGFNFLRADRGSRGGGVGAYVRSGLEVKVIEIEDATEKLEQIWFSLKINQINISCGILYRPPASSITDALDALNNSLSNIIPISDEVVIMGDLNIDLCKINNYTDLFNSTLEAFDLNQVVIEPTRCCGKSSSLLDVIALTNIDDLVGPVTHVDLHEVTDHQLTYCSLKINLPRTPPKLISYRDFSSFDAMKFNSDLRNQNWNTILDVVHIDQKVNVLVSTILQLFDMHAPMRTVRVTKPKAPWFTDVLKIMKKHRNRLWSKYKKSKCPRDFEQYKTMRNLFTAAVRAEKKGNINYVQKNKNKKELWKTLEQMNVYKRKKSKSQLPVSISDPEKINNFFIDSVSSIAAQVDTGTIENYRRNRCCDAVFAFQSLTDDDVLSAISRVKSNAAGPDGVTLEMVKLCSPVIVPFLTHIYNESIRSSRFPSEWKRAFVLPLPKVSNPQNESELRPISLLCVLSKIFEKAIYEQVIKFLERNNLITEYQSGFRKGFSTTTAMLNVLDDILEASDREKTTALVLLDFTKAFDTVNHKLLTAKLQFYGFDTTSVKFFENYLAGRSQCVVVNCQMSQYINVATGVPQGSILGPLLFLIYTMDMCKNISNCSCHQYADDTQLYYSFKKDQIADAQDIINNELSVLQGFSNQNGLKLNTNKCAVIYLGSNKLHAAETLRISVNDEVLPVKTEVNKVQGTALGSLRNLYKSTGY